MRITVFDFDDTLFCTSYFAKTPEVEFGNYGEHVQQTLELAINHSDRVFIITNADIDWMCLVCLKELPKLRRFIFENITIISTVTSGFNTSPVVNQWKINCFDALLGKMFENYSEDQHHLLHFGDTPYDKNASISMLKHKNVFVKHVNFILAPTIHDLILQHTVVQQEFSEYFFLEKNIYDTLK